MNKTYKVVWNAASESWIAVPEFAKAKGKGRGRAVAVASVSSVLSLLTGSAHALGPANSYSVGLLGPGGLCLNTQTLTGLSTGSSCDGGGSFAAGTVAYTATGAMDSWMIIDANKTISMGVNKNKMFTISASAGINAYADLSMNTSNKIKDLKAGDVYFGSQDAINGSQLYDLASSTAASLGGRADVEDGTVTPPTYSVYGTAYHNVGDALDALQIGFADKKYFHANSTLADSSASGVESVAIGGNAQATADNSVALGSNSVADRANSVSVGAAGAERQIINVADGANGTDAVNVSQLKNEIGTNLANVVKYDNDTHTSVTLGGSKTAPAVTLDNVAAGEVSGNSLQAVNGSQLFNVAQSTADALGGGASVSPDGKVTAPTYTFADNSSFNNVGNALSNLDGRVASNTSFINNINNGGGIKYFHANSTLADSSASGVESVAIGGNAQATANNSVALGSNSVADRANSVSVGAKDAERQITNVAEGANGTDAVNVSQLKNEIGTNLANVVKYDADDHKSVTLGGSKTAPAVTLDNVAAGEVSGNSLQAVNGSQLFNVAQSTADALGGGASVSPDGKVTAPTYTFADNSSFNNVGNALSNLDGRVASNTSFINNINNGGGIKYFHANSTLADSSASGVESVAIGGNAQATADNSVALGSNSVADRANSVSVGAKGAERQIINVADGANGTDAVNVSQLKNEIGTNLANVVKYDNDTHTSVTLGGSKTAPAVTLDNVAAGEVSGNSLQAVNGSQLFDVAQSTADALGGGASVSPDGKVTAPTYTFADNSSFNNVGNALSNLDGRVASNTSFINNINNGGGIKYFHANSTLADSSASGVESVAIGGNAQATADNSVALGSNSVADRANSVSVGAKGAERQIINVADGANGTDAVNVSQLKNEIGTNLANVVKYDADDHKSVTLGGSKTAPAVTLDNVAAGEVSGNSLQAVNGSQLFDVAQSTADALGGGASVSPDGKVKAPTYTFADNSSFNNVGNALSNLDGRVASNTSFINNINNGGGIKYFHANSTLADSSASGVESVAIGGNAQALANNSVALGSNSVADRANSVSVGAAGAERQIINVADGANGTDAVNVSQLKNEIGTNLANVVKYDNDTHTSVTLGGSKTAPAVTLDNVAAGEVSGNSLQAVNGSQLFDVAQSTADALGGGASVSPDGKVTAPTYTFADNSSFNNVGNALSNLDGRVASNTSFINNINNGGGIKYFHANSTLADSSASGVESVAIGGNAQATADNSVALGSNSVADRANSVSVGAKGAERQIINVAEGANGTDAVNVSQLKNEIGTNLANVVKYDDDTHTSVTLGGKGAPAVTLDNVAAGEVSGNSLQAVNGSQLFNVAQSTADALGGGASVDSDGKVTAPTYTFADNSTFNNVGNALSDLDGRVAANTSDIGNMVNGGGIKYFHANSTLADSLATGEESVAIGGNAQATANNSVALGSNSVADRANTVSVGAKGAERQITNVAAGKEDTDAVNVAQLKAAGLINGDGTAKTAVTYDTTASGETDYSSITLGDGNSGGTVIHNVANGMDGTDAVNLNQMNAALDSVKNIAESGGNPMFAAQGNRDTEAAIATGAHATAMGANANASADNSVALGANSVADRVNTVSVGSAGNERQITNVAAGTQATDAVNVQQLNLAAAQAQSYTDSRISGVQQQISDVASKAYGGIASAMAVAGLPQPTAPGKTMVAMAGSRYAGATGAALGVSYVTQDERWVVKLSGNTSSYGNVGFVFGSGYQW